MPSAGGSLPKWPSCWEWTWRTSKKPLKPLADWSRARDVISTQKTLIQQETDLAGRPSLRWLLRITTGKLVKTLLRANRAPTRISSRSLDLAPANHGGTRTRGALVLEVAVAIVGLDPGVARCQRPGLCAGR